MASLEDLMGYKPSPGEVGPEIVSHRIIKALANADVMGGAPVEVAEHKLFNVYYNDVEFTNAIHKLTVELISRFHK